MTFTEYFTQKQWKSEEVRKTAQRYKAGIARKPAQQAQETTSRAEVVGFMVCASDNARREDLGR